tara:strand:+ start:140 stop:2455 length:2316 start_codon:yes stop_codon:yes gene_type:complete
MLKRLGRDVSVKAENITPEEMQKIIDESVNDTFDGNPTLRQENSSILRPIKQVTLKVLDGEIGIINSFLSFQVAHFLKKYPKDPKVQSQMATAARVVQLMGAKQLKATSKALSKLNIAPKITAALKNPSPAVRKFMLKEANFMLMSVIGMFIWMGIYDGLDVYAIKDRILNLDPLAANNSWSNAIFAEYAFHMTSRNLYGLFNNRFDLFYDKMLDSKKFGARIVQVIDKKADLLGRKIYKATRRGLELNKGESLATRLGLVGVGEGTQFTLRGLLKSFSVGIAYGLIANFAVDTVGIGIKGYNDSAMIGANRDKKVVRPEYNGYMFQRSNSEIKNWFRERKYALLDTYDYYTKTPLTKVFSTVTGFTGAYIGSVVAGALVLGGSLPGMVGGVMIASVFGGIGSFLGNWATMKFERGEWMKGVRRKLVERRLFKAILKMDIYEDRQMTKAQARELARMRSFDMKKLEDMGRVYRRLHLVDHFDNVELYRQGKYQYMRVLSRHGEAINVESHNRYTFVDIEGHRGSWDFGTQQIFNVGKIEDNNGYSVVFVTDNENVPVNGGVISNEKGCELRVLSNGIIMTKSEIDRSRWAIRGININTDVFLRKRKIRYTWDYELNAFRQVDKIVNLASDLSPLLEAFEAGSDTQKRNKLNRIVQQMIKSSHAKAKNLLKRVNENGEEDFFTMLQENGVGDDAIENFKGMDFTEWKNFLHAKLERGYHRRVKRINDIFEKQSVEDLQDALVQEISSPDSETCYDSLRVNLNQAELITSYTN